MAGQLDDNGSPAPLLMTSPSSIHQAVSRLVLPGLDTGVMDGNNDVNAVDEPTLASQRQLFPDLEPELTASEQKAVELRERMRKLDNIPLDIKESLTDVFFDVTRCARRGIMAKIRRLYYFIRIGLTFCRTMYIIETGTLYLIGPHISFSSEG